MRQMKLTGPVKLTVEEHAEIAKHLHAADHHLLDALHIMCNYNGTKNVPGDIISEIEKVRDEIGAASSASRHAKGDIVHQCQDVLFNDWPGSTLDTYYGSYAECETSSA
jgi:hypothetical protein